MEELKKRKMGTYVGNRLDKLFSLLGGSRSLSLSLSDTCEDKMYTAVSYLSELLHWYGSAGGIEAQ